MSEANNPSDEVRPMRWLPLLSLVLTTAYFISLMLAPAVYFPVLGGVGGAIWILPSIFWMMGPLRARPSEDECEIARRRDAYLFALFAIGGLNLMVEPLMMGMAFLHHWTAERVIMGALGLLITSFFLLPTLATLHFSWSMSREEEDQADGTVTARRFDRKS